MLKKEILKAKEHFELINDFFNEESNNEYGSIGNGMTSEANIASERLKIIFLKLKKCNNKKVAAFCLMLEHEQQ